ncbi:VOC family protein [Longispora urticae]
MPQRTSYPQGTPNWAELRTTEPETARSFYGRLFGWDFTDTPQDGYTLAVLDGEVVAALTAGTGPAWHVYLAVDDVDTVAEAVPGAGGTVLEAPADAGPAGRAAVVRDPTGAAVGLWQAGRRQGAGLVGEPGTVAWNELLTGDVDAAVRFYQRIVGLIPEAVEVDPALGGVRWSTLKAGGEPVAGVVPTPAQGAPARWNVYFGTDDIAASADRATALGGTLLLAPTETPIGPMAGVRDPQGASFSLWTPRIPG